MEKEQGLGDLFAILNGEVVNKNEITLKISLCYDIIRKMNGMDMMILAKAFEKFTAITNGKEEKS